MISYSDFLPNRWLAIMVFLKKTIARTEAFRLRYVVGYIRQSHITIGDILIALTSFP